jgi:hypothetical protein
MARSRSSNKNDKPTLREVMAGYRVFNDWERDELSQQLPNLSIADSVNQFLELCVLAQMTAPDAGAIFLAEDKAHWVTLNQKRQKAARKMGYASTASGIAGSSDVS